MIVSIEMLTELLVMKFVDAIMVGYTVILMLKLEVGMAKELINKV